MRFFFSIWNTKHVLALNNSYEIWTYNSSYMASFPGDFYFINEKQNSCFKKNYTDQHFHLKNALILKKATSSV